MTAPERIRVAQDADGFWTCREAVSGSQEYVRADLYAALEAQLAARTGAVKVPSGEIEEIVSDLEYWSERLADMRQPQGQSSLKHAAYILSALEATPPAPKVTEALKAALTTMYRYQRAGYGDDVFYDDLSQSIRKVEAAFAAAKEAHLAERVKAKPLEWKERVGVNGTFDAYTSIGHYIATITDDDRGMWFAVGLTQSNYCAPDIDIAKADAQSDYERRILSALEATTAPQTAERVRVKPLVWKPLPNTESESGYGAGRSEYPLIRTENGWRVYCIPSEGDSGIEFPTKEAAKAAAQADFERRILSALEPAAPEGQQEPMPRNVIWFGFDENTGEFTGEYCSVKPADARGMRPYIPYTARPSEQAVTDAMVEALKRIRDTAMEHTLAARIPESGVFGSIAQDADWILSELTAAQEASHAHQRSD